MAEIITLAPHDPMPEGRTVVVLRRFEEDRPTAVSIEIVLSGKARETTHPRRPDGAAMSLDEAVAAAGKVAESEGLDRVYVLDRLSGERERDVLEHGGDHTVHMDQLQDTDEEDDVRGTDMRDIAHPVPGT